MALISLRIGRVHSGSSLFLHSFYSGRWFCNRATMVLIRLHECIRWTGALLSPNGIRVLFVFRIVCVDRFYLNVFRVVLIWAVVGESVPYAHQFISVRPQQWWGRKESSLRTPPLSAPPPPPPKKKKKKKKKKNMRTMPGIASKIGATLIRKNLLPNSFL